MYPAQPATLLSTVQELLAQSPSSPSSPSSPAVAVIVPHSGFQYSGRTAGEVFARVEVPRRCIVVAPNHTGAGLAKSGGSAWAVGAYRTPLGDVAIDELLAAALLARCPLVEDDPDAHRTEHGVEVVLPFLLALRPDVAVVPVVVSWSDWPRTRALAEALAETVRSSAEPVLLVGSTDMNHFEPADETRRKDDLALDAMKRIDGEELLDVTRKHRISMCGRAAAAAVLHAARLLGAMKGDVVHYSTTGDATHDNTAVVGFAGMVIR